MGTTSDKLTYLNGTKSAIKDSINLGGGTLTTEPFREYASAIKDRYLDFMNNGIDVVWDNWEKVVGEGTSLTLNNTVEAPMKIEYIGNTSQEGTPTPDTPQPIHVVSGDNEVEVVGKNLFDKNTIVAGDVCNQNPTIRLSSRQSKYIEAGTYTISTNLDLSTYNYAFQLIETAPPRSNYTNIYDTMWLSVSSKTITLTQSGYMLFAIRKQNNGTLTVEDIQDYDFQLEKGSTATPYEPYTGAIYPISLMGKNIFNDSVEVKNAYVSTTVGSVATYTNSSASYTYVNCAYLEANKTYTLSWVKNTPANTGNRNSVIVDNNNIVLEAVTRTWTNDATSLTFTPTHSGYFILTTDKNATNIQIEKGSQSTEYVNYNPIELCSIGDYKDRFFKTSGKNLINEIVVGIMNTNGTFDSSVTAWNTTGYIKINSNSNYNLSWKPKTTGSYWQTRVIYFNESKTYVSGSDLSSYPANYQYAITTPNNVAYMKLSFTNTGNYERYDIMLNEGTTALPYEPYGTGWYLEKKIGKVVLDGSNAYVYDGQSFGNYFRVYAIIPDLYKNPITNANLYANYFYGDENALSSSKAKPGMMAQYKDRNYIYFMTDETSVANFKTWLSTHNTIAYYPLATPTYTKIEGTLKEQLEEIKKSKNGQTNISQTNNDLPFVLDVSALKE